MTISKRYNHIYRLTLYYQGAIKFQFANKNDASKNIDFEANIIRDGFESGTSDSEIYIYNLSQSKRDNITAIIANSTVNLDDADGTSSSFQFQIEATYQYGSTPYTTLCYDDVIGCYNTLSSVDQQTVFNLRSGGDAATRTFAANSYSSGTTAETILTNLAQSMVDNHSITSYYINPTMNNYTFQYGFSQVGNTFDLIKKVCELSQNICYIENGKLYIAPAAQVNSGQSKVYVLNYSNGLLQYPQIGQTNYKRKYTDDYSVVSYDMQSLLLPFIRLNDQINVNSTLYTVKKIEHSIHSRNGEAFTRISGVKNYQA